MFIPFQIGKYTVVDRIRVGGMGETLLAQCIDCEGDIRRVAVKRPLPSVMELPRALEMFWLECTLLEKVGHPAFPAFIESGVAGNLPFLAMEYVEGKSLRNLVKGQTPATMPSVETWIYVATKLAEAAEWLHAIRTSEGLPTLHGDIHLSNVMISRQGDVRLLDLGMASMMSRKSWHFGATMSDFQPPFLAGKAAAPVVDTFAIGRCLFECLAGREASQIETAGCGVPLPEILSRATDRRGLFTYQTATDLASELRSCLTLGKEDVYRSELSKLYGF